MADNQRAARMAKRIQMIVATAIDREIKDPRLEFVTVTDTKMTGDLHDATVYYTVRGETIDDEPNIGLAQTALERAKGQLRKRVGDDLGVRFTPTLSFIHDTVPEESAHMEELLAKARARDEEIRAQAAQAEPAGEENPYKDSDD